MEGKHLDEHIRKALENLEAGYDPHNWDAFEERLDAANTSPVAQDPLESAALRLESLETPLPPSGWESMLQRIEAEEAAEIIENEAAIDNLVYEKLNRMEVPLQHSHWHLMAKRLEEEFSLLHKLYRYKVAEVALMALLLLTIIRFVPFAGHLLEQRSDGNQLDTTPAPAAAAPAATAINNIGETASPITVPGPPISETTSAQALTANPSASAQAKGANSGDTYARTGRSTELQGATSVFGGNRTAAALPIPMTSIHPFAAHSLLWENMWSEQGLAFLQKKTGTHAGEQGMEKLAMLPTGPVQPKYAWEVPQVQKGLVKKESEIRFSIFTATDINYVFTPQNKLNVFDTLVSTRPDTTLASGYGGGILASWKRDKWEVQTGGIYSFKRYIPNTPVFLFETMNYYVREEFHGVQLDLLQVPLNLQYHFKNTGKWRFYGNGGFSGHFITSSVYEITHERTPVFKIAAMPPPEGPDVLADNSTIRNEKSFPKGLFSGGDFRSNFYLTANVGLGMERYVSSRWSLFFQPNYHHYLLSEGVGTNKDKFYTLSFNLGTKFSVK